MLYFHHHFPRPHLTTPLGERHYLLQKTELAPVRQRVVLPAASALHVHEQRILLLSPHLPGASALDELRECVEDYQHVLRLFFG